MIRAPLFFCRHACCSVFVTSEWAIESCEAVGRDVVCKLDAASLIRIPSRLFELIDNGR